MTKEVRVGSAVGKPGERTTGELVLGHMPDRPISSPVTIVQGTAEGPVLWAQGCVHGPEIGGPASLLRFLDALDPRAMRGTFVAVMLASPTSFRGYSRNSPVDGENLNRVFPGDLAGPHSRQNAALLFEAALGTADALVDLHSGGDRSVVPFYALYWNDGSEASKRAGELARACGTPDIWASTDPWLRGAMFTHLTRRGIPSLIVECGGGAQLPEEHIRSYVTALRGVAQALGILPGEPPRQERYSVMDNALLVYSKRGGLFEPAVGPGERVDKGQLLGTLRDLYGATAEEVRAPSGPGWIGSIRRAWMPVHSGDQIAEVIHYV
jgi:predicted deacylase